MTSRLDALPVLIKRQCQRVPLREITFTLLLCCLSPSHASAAVIKSLTLGPVFAVRGDLVTLGVEPMTPDAKVEWWLAGDVICESWRCEFDTSEFTPGEYIYHVVVKNASGIETAEISISTESSPPLYKPKKLNALRSGPNKKASFVENGQWIMIPREGFISTTKRPASKKKTVTDFAEKPSDGRRYVVSHDGLVIFRRIGDLESWLLLGGSSFKIDQGQFSLISGAGVWRTSQAGAASGQDAKIFGLGVRANPGQIIVARTIGGENSNRTQIQNLQGAAMVVRCPDDKELQILEKSQIDMTESINCRQVTPEAWDGVETILAKTFSWWTSVIEKSPMDQWRMEAVTFNLFAKGDSSTETQIKEAFNSGRCADVLDLSSRFVSPSSEVMLLRARCQFNFGMRKEALKNLRLLDVKKFDPPEVAFLLARLFHQSADFEKALDWYREALGRGYEDRPNLARNAALAAREARLSRTQLGWLDAVALNEKDSAKVPAALQNASLWRDGRPSGASLEIGAVMDSQAAPVNAKEVFPMPNNIKESRSMVTSFDGDWWFNRSVAKNSSIVLSGSHVMRLPLGIRQSPFSIGKHDIKLGLGVDSRRGAEEQSGFNKGWLLKPAVVLGVGMLGSYRVRERFGWEMKISYQEDKVYSLTIMSDKYLDPAPGGVDIVDIDLYRLTAPGDFSHIDNVLRGEIAGAIDEILWTVSVDLGRVDYRLPESIGFDHNLSRMIFSATYRMSPAMMFEIIPKYTARNYYKAGANEICVELKSAIGWRPVPLWKGEFLLGYESRRISNDPVSSWTRHIYGVSVSTDL